MGHGFQAALRAGNQSSGFIGTHVVRRFTDTGHRVVGFDLLPPDEPFPEGSIYLCGDIRIDRLPYQGIDAVVHLAALAGAGPRWTGHSTTSQPT
jgi:nucleoside-diphosphate-sugar epimerase